MSSADVGVATDEAESIRTIHGPLDQGTTLIDTVENYCLKEGRRPPIRVGPTGWRLWGI
jgi:aryl-alcohol dehydrogenase-like predicted oxidoreductase